MEQYLAYLEQMKRMDMEIASEFIAMASHLMLIKTKMLLSAAEQAEALSEMEQLIQSLQERQRQEACERIRTAAALLEQRSEQGLGLFTKGPEPFERDRRRRICCGPSRQWPSAAKSSCPRPGPALRASWAGNPIPLPKRLRSC